jgi:hypothetical protein
MHRTVPYFPLKGHRLKRGFHFPGELACATVVTFPSQQRKRKAADFGKS